MSGTGHLSADRFDTWVNANIPDGNAKNRILNALNNSTISNLEELLGMVQGDTKAVAVSFLMDDDVGLNLTKTDATLLAGKLLSLGKY